MHGRLRSLVLALLSMTLAGYAPGQAPTPTAQHDVFAFVRALDEAGAKGVWPGFNPSDWPVALFDGEQTVLLRHPNPPPEFNPMPGRPGVLVSPGRYPTVVANSTREIGGVRTATVIATPGQNVESTLLATVEEVFHVYWLAGHPSFRPDEMVRYAYPVKDVENLRRMLAENEALARALEADAEQESAQWAATALQVRRDRTRGLEDAARTFETALEMMEGTANYTARRSLGQGPRETAARLRTERPAEGIRWRFYDSGTALCFLLDRFDPTWKIRSNKEPEITIVDLLIEALAHRRVEPHTFSEAEVGGFQARALHDVADLADRQQRLRAELLARAGPRLVVEVADGGAPFSVKRFDPINLLVLDEGEVVQADFITLAGPGGTVEMTNPAFSRSSFAGTVAVTVSAGSHPLAAGIRQVTIVGIGDVPRVHLQDDTITVVAPGVRLELRGASGQTKGDTTHITVRPRSPAG